MRQLQASGIVLEQYEDAVCDGLSQRLQCRVAASSITYSQSLESATITEAYGEFFVKGSMAYQFVAQEAAITCNHPTGVVKVTGDLQIRGLRSGARLTCQAVIWDPAASSLCLEGLVTLKLKETEFTTQKLLICTIADFANLQNLPDKTAFISKVADLRGQDAETPGNICVLGGSCRAMLRIPATLWKVLNLDMKNGFDLHNMWLGVARKLVGYGLPCIQKFFCALSRQHLEKNSSDVVASHDEFMTLETRIEAEGGMVLQTESGLLSSLGKLNITSPGTGAKINAGGGDFLLKDGIVVLHGKVSALWKNHRFQVSKLTLYGRKEKNLLNHLDCVNDLLQSLCRLGAYSECVTKFAGLRQPLQMSPKDHQSALEKFKLSISGMRAEISKSVNFTATFASGELVAGMSVARPPKLIITKGTQLFSGCHLRDMSRRIASALRSCLVRRKSYLGFEVGQFDNKLCEKVQVNGIHHLVIAKSQAKYYRCRTGPVLVAESM